MSRREICFVLWLGIEDTVWSLMDGWMAFLLGLIAAYVVGIVRSSFSETEMTPLD